MADPDYFTTAELAQMPDCGSFTEAQVLAAAAYFTAIVEREVGQPFIPRTYTETLDGTGTTTVVLPHGHIRSLTTVTLDGVAVTTTLLTAESGVLRYIDNGTTWTLGASNLVVVYVAGAYATCPGDIKDAVMWATRDRLLSQGDRSGIDVRRTSMSDALGGTTTYLLPGEKRPTGYPDLDALIASYTRNVASYGFA